MWNSTKIQHISLPIYTVATSKIPRPPPWPGTSRTTHLGDAIDNLRNEKRQSYGGKYTTAPDGKVVPVPNYALAAVSGAVAPRITTALGHCQRSPSCPKKRLLRHAANRKLVGGDRASYPWRGSHHKCLVIRSFTKHNTEWLFRFNISHSSHSEDRASWYILIMKANEMHCFSDLFDKVLYMFRTGPLSIISSISTLYIRNSYLSCWLCWLPAGVSNTPAGSQQNWDTLDGGQWTCPKHVRYFIK